MFDDIAYDVNLEYCRINAAPLTGAVSQRYNVGIHKLLNSLTQGTEAWKWIESYKVGRDNMKTLMENYDGSTEGESCMKITKADMKEL